MCLCLFFFFKQKTAYELRISDWSSDVCSSDLHAGEDGDVVRVRKVIGGWCKSSLHGTPLGLDGLSSRLTQVTGYRKTICRVKAPEYVVRRINGTEAPVMARARAARAALVAEIGRAHV